jgi:hypothetical protein
MIYSEESGTNITLPTSIFLSIRWNFIFRKMLQLTGGKKLLKNLLLLHTWRDIKQLLAGASSHHIATPAAQVHRGTPHLSSKQKSSLYWEV